MDAVIIHEWASVLQKLVVNVHAQGGSYVLNGLFKRREVQGVASPGSSQTTYE